MSGNKYDSEKGEETPLLAPKCKESTRKQACKSRMVLIMLVVIVLQVISGMGGGLSVLYVEIIRVFDTSRTLAALVQSMFIGIAASTGLLWTSVINRLGAGMSIVVGSCIATVGIFVSAFAPNVYFLIVLTGIVAGLGISVVFLGSFMIAGWTVPKHRTAAVALSTTGTSFGMFLFPTFINYLLEEYGLSGTYIMLSGVTLNIIPLGLILQFSQQYFDTGQDSKKKSASFDIKLFTNFKFLLLLFLAILIGFFGTIETWFLVDLLMLRGFSRDTGSTFISIAGLANMFGRIFGTAMGLCKSVHLLVHSTYAFALVGVAHALVLYLMEYAGLLMATILFGFSYGITVATLPGVYMEVLGIKHFPQAYGSRNACAGFGIFFGGLLGGFIKDVSGSYDLLFEISIGAMAFTSMSFIVLFIKMKTKSPKGTPSSNALLYAKLKADSQDSSQSEEDHEEADSYRKCYERLQKSCTF